MKIHEKLYNTSRINENVIKGFDRKTHNLVYAVDDRFILSDPFKVELYNKILELEKEIQELKNKKRTNIKKTTTKIKQK